MTEIPEHLKKRAKEARDRAVFEGGLTVELPPPKVLPENSVYPWNALVDVAAKTMDTHQAIILNMGMNAIHEQLCVIADLLRIQIGEK